MAERGIYNVHFGVRDGVRNAGQKLRTAGHVWHPADEGLVFPGSAGSSTLR